MDSSPQYIDRLISSENFYFEHGRLALRKWLDDITLTIDQQNQLHPLIKDYRTFSQLPVEHAFAQIRDLFFEIISYCDLHANGKEFYNKYEDKRTLARAGVRMNDWCNHIFNYKYDNAKTSSSVKNALNMLLIPTENISYLSVGHRNKISEKYLEKPYDENTFVKEISDYFSKDIEKWAVDDENNTLLISRRIYDLEDEWNITTLTFTQYVDDLKRYILENNLQFSFGKKTPRQKYIWISDKDGYFMESDAHYEIIITDDEISIDLHFERKKSQNDELFNSFKTFSDNIIPKQWHRSQSLSHIRKFNLSDENLVEDSVACLQEIFDETYPILIEKLKHRYPLKSFDMNTEDEIKEIAELLEYKKQIILKGPPGTGKTRMAEKVAQFIIGSQINFESDEKFEMTKDIILEHITVGLEVKSKSGISYIVQEINEGTVGVKSESSKTWYPSFNNIIRSYNNKLYKEKKRGSGFIPYEDAIAMYLEKTVEKSSLPQVNPADMLIGNSPYYKIVQFHPSYSYEDFVRGIVAKPSDKTEGIVYEGANKLLAEFANTAFDNKNKKYVLVIDEINRANLSSVLGELIYALEYRESAVESMYQVDGDNTFILPNNLLIIGTMNTADRSVGHIDYAIRRRFSFVEIGPKNLENDKSIVFDSTLFKKVGDIFENHTSEDFRVIDVQLGHSYFIDKKEVGGPMKTRLKYEIKPILHEYVQDGILKESAMTAIDDLVVI